MKTLNLLMGLHCHQPIDNLGSIFEDAYNRSYNPFLRVLSRHPGIKLSLHYSGPVLEWLLRKKPDFIERLKGLINKGQVEILTGGYYEPIIPMIPERDAKGQIEMLTDLIQKHLNVTPCGSWLAERVWSPGVAGIFRALGIRYTILDDFHMKRAGVRDWQVSGYYESDNADGLFVFASVKKLRYTMPFREIGVSIDFFKKLLDENHAQCVTFADDCEKFGLWPYTYDWVYKKGWLDNFFTALEQNDWIRTMTFTEAIREYNPSGKISVPHSSYAEMVKWCNGDFSNFFEKYPESNRMRSRMLFVSEQLDRSPARGEAKGELYKSQSNCAYWHGIFGGVYTKYLRHGVYSHIIKAEKFLEDKKSEIGTEVIQLEDDRENIIRLHNKQLNLFVDPRNAGSICEIDYIPLSFNLVDTMSRRYEPYHEKLKNKRKIDIEDLRKKIEDEDSFDLYEILGVREKNLKKYLNYDLYPKLSSICHVMAPGTTINDFIKSTHIEAYGNEFMGAFSHEIEEGDEMVAVLLGKTGNINGHKLKIKKHLILHKDSEILIKFDLENNSSEALKFVFGVEFNWSLEDRFFMRPRMRKGVRKISLEDRFYGVKIEHIFNEPLGLWSFPVYTLNESDKGLGKNFQEISLLFHRGISLEGGAKFFLETTIGISG